MPEQVMLLPDDEYNKTLLDNVHPAGWVNPQPSGRYNIVVIGAGTAGLVTAAIAAGVGAKVALIEKHLLGGDCLNVGCVPSKGIIRASRAWAQMQNAEEFGIHIPGAVKYDFSEAMARMRRLRARISRTDSAHRYKSLGVDVFIGEGRFSGRDTIEVGGTTLTFKKAAICTGARAAAPNVEGLGLEKVGVAFTGSGVKVNDRLQTTNARIYAAGDICSPFKFTHAADAMAQVVIQNALFPHPFGLAYAGTDSLLIPWCTYTQPEIAHVGLYEADAKAKRWQVQTFTYKLDEVDRAILDGEDEGFARIHVRKGTDKILGATIVGAHAGEMISEFTVLMKTGQGLKTLISTIHPYPTQAEVIKKVGNAWRKANFTESQKNI